MKIIITIFISVFLSIGVFAQNKSKQLDQLKKELNIPKSSNVTVNNNKMFPEGDTIKVFLSIKHNQSFAKDFDDWIEDWNRTNAAQSGTLQVVDKIEDADVIVSQFRHGTREYIREDSVSVSTNDRATQNTDISGTSRDDDFFGRTVGNSKVKARRGHRRLNFPLYSYILVRAPFDNWIVNYSYIEDSLRGREKFSASRLRKKIKKRMKNR